MTCPPLYRSSSYESWWVWSGCFYPGAAVVAMHAQGHRDPESGAVVLTPVRPSARALLEQRNALLQEPGFEAELEALFEGLRDTRPAEPVEFL